MNSIKLVQKIGTEVCEGCGPDTDCGIDPMECDRVFNAVSWLSDFVKQKNNKKLQLDACLFEKDCSIYKKGQMHMDTKACGACKYQHIKNPQFDFCGHCGRPLSQ